MNIYNSKKNVLANWKPVNVDFPTNIMAFSNPKHEAMPPFSSNKYFSGLNKDETNLKS